MTSKKVGARQKVQEEGKTHDKFQAVVGQLLLYINTLTEEELTTLPEGVEDEWVADTVLAAWKNTSRVSFHITLLNLNTVT